MGDCKQREMGILRAERFKEAGVMNKEDGVDCSKQRGHEGPTWKPGIL